MITRDITLTNHRRHRESSDAVHFQAKACSRRKARENVCVLVATNFVLTLDWLKKWHKILKAIPKRG